MTSGSSVSVQRSLKSVDHRSNSCDTVCTSNSSCFLQRRKPMNPLMYPVRPNYQRTSGNGVRQRVLSAKLLKLRSIQNQLNDANFHLSELSKENQILKNLQKRQDKALSKYEGMNEDLPRLIHAHEEQLRVVTEKNKSLRKNVKELTEVLKAKEEELTKVNEKLVHLEKLNKDKHLTDREKLLDQLEDTKLKLQKSDEQNTVLNRKLMLEGKTSKQRLNSEISKHKQCQRQLNQALSEIDRLTGLLEAKENVVHPPRANRFARRSSQRQSVSMVSLDGYQPKRTASSDKLTTIYDSEADQSNKLSTIYDSQTDGSNKVTSIYNSEIDVNKTPVKDVKLEPIKCKTGDTLKKLNGILTMPSENIKNRLSNPSTPSRGSVEFSLNTDKEHSSGSETLSDTRENSADSEQRTRVSSYYKFDKLPDTLQDNKQERSRPNSSVKLEKLSKHLDQAIQRATVNTNDEFEKKLGIYCSEIMTNVKNCNDRIELQKESLKMSKEDTDNILETFEKTKNIESKLKKSLFNFEASESDFLNDILSDEMKLQANKDKNATDKNGNVMKKDRVKIEERKRLLATLKAIDNGESIDSIDNSPSHEPTSLMHHILSDMPK